MLESERYLLMQQKENDHSQQNLSLDEVSDSLVSAIWIYDVDNYRICWANKAALQMWQTDSLTELTSRDFKPGTSKAVQETLRDYQLLFQQEKTLTRMWQYSPKGVQKEAFCQMSGFVLDNNRIGLLCEAIPGHLLDNKTNPNSVVILSTYNLHGRFISGNPPFIQTFLDDAYDLDQLLIDSRDKKGLLLSIKSHETYEMDVLVSTKNGQRWHRMIANMSHNDNGQQTILLQQFDINERKLAELSSAREAITDPLTGLLNRRGLERELNKENKKNDRFVIFYIDLDGFKMINDYLGHSVGDHILKTLSQRLLSIKDTKAFACRYGGDEFVWIVKEKDMLINSDELANKLINSLNRPYFNEQSQPMLVSASIGIAHYPEDGHDFSKLILRADAAMYLAKKQGKRRWVNYINGMENGLRRQSKIGQHLFSALAQSRLMLYYQPIYNVELNHIDSFEALLRWNDPVLGWVPPAEIICVAEETGIIADLEYWIIERAVADLIKLRQYTADKITMAINISGVHFTDPTLVKYIVEKLNQYNLPRDAIIIELTENALLSDIDNKNNSVDRFAESGLCLSIDDFGTGFSSLAYLHKIPASIVKIDQSFTHRLADDSSLIASIHQLIQSQGFKTLVEGVETMSQSLILKNMGICLQQGYALGYPEPLEFYLKN